jgi:hypothetical protein
VHDERLVQRTPDQADALLDEVGGLLSPSSAACSAMRARASSGRIGRPEELVDRAQVDRHRVHLALVGGVDLVHVVGEGREPVHVLPDPLVAGVEQVRAVAVHLDARRRVVLGVGVAADVAAPVDDRHPEAQIVGARSAIGETEKPGSDDDEVC